MHHNLQLRSFSKLFKRVGAIIWDSRKCDLIESKWGHRIMDQIFREGKFHPVESCEHGPTEKNG